MYVSRLPCEDGPIFLKEFDERKFRFRIQGIAYVSNLGRFLRGQWDWLAVCVLRLDGHLGSLGLGHDRVWGELGQGLLQFLEFYGCRQSVGSLTTLLVTIESPLDVSPDGDDVTRSWHLQNQVGVMWNCNELGECRSFQESIVRSLKISDLELYSLCVEIQLSPKNYWERYLTDGSRYCTWDYAMERGPTAAQKGLGQPHLVKSL
jgi:hypothetical protein